MKRVVCLLLIVLIACAGCADKKTRIFTLIPGDPPTWRSPGGGEPWKSPAVHRYEIAKWEMKLNKVEEELDRVKDMLKQSELRNEASLVRMAELKESQRSEIESSENATRLYEIVIESQKLTIETLQKLCLLYEE